MVWNHWLMRLKLRFRFLTAHIICNHWFKRVKLSFQFRIVHPWFGTTDSLMWNLVSSFAPHVRGWDPLVHACATWVQVSPRTSVVGTHWFMREKFGFQFRPAHPWFGPTGSCVRICESSATLLVDHFALFGASVHCPGFGNSFSPLLFLLSFLFGALWSSDREWSFLDITIDLLYASLGFEAAYVHLKKKALLTAEHTCFTCSNV
jgi:hypothetical protein